LTWDEVKRLSVGMEVDGFVAFAGAHSLIPGSMSLTQCEALAKEVIARYPLIANGPALSTSLLYPQFQLLLCLVAIERAEILSRTAAAAAASAPSQPAQSGSGSSQNIHKEKTAFAAKKVGITGVGAEHDQRPIADLLSDLLREMGVDKSTATYNPPNAQRDGIGTGNSADNYDAEAGMSRLGLGAPGTIIAPSSHRPVDQYTASMSHMRQAMLLRLQHLFDEISDRLGQFQVESGGAFGATDFNMTGMTAATNTATQPPPPPTAPTPTAKGKGEKEKNKEGKDGRSKSSDKGAAAAAAKDSTATAAAAAPSTPAATAPNTAAAAAAPTADGAQTGALGQSGPFGLSAQALLGPAAGASEDPNANAPLDGKKMTSKPMVIGDALPVPSSCPEMVEQMLQVR
jgi:hypothetical protein